jgi:hypothetical protein
MMHKGMVGRIPSSQDNGPASDKTLGDYVNRKYSQDMVPARGTRTFEDWYLSVEMQTYDKTEYDCMKMAWAAAQENK